MFSCEDVKKKNELIIFLVCYCKGNIKLEYKNVYLKIYIVLLSRNVVVVFNVVLRESVINLIGRLKR